MKDYACPRFACITEGDRFKCEDLIMANVRTPDERQGDLRAQVAANHRACQRLVDLASKYGVHVLTRIMQEVMDYSERLMRVMLSDLPDGSGLSRTFVTVTGLLKTVKMKTRLSRFACRSKDW
ncbi:MAG: hypothetical protein CM1200mP20_00420 [Pseudomonadota bacterium]|nr:MAG: hypothetical protein CM1200mP20_00420 [Pseudomonadota bacterium]